MGFKFMTWNVKQFKAATPSRIQKIADHIGNHDPDIFGIIEFMAKDAARKIITDFYSDYDFAMTDSKMQIDFLIGWRRNKFEQVLYTQRRDFRAGNINLRPGGLLSFKESGQNIFTNMLFLHTDSGKSDKEYKTRKKMFSKIWSLKNALENLPIQQGSARLIALGDLNTMGRSKTDTLPTIRAKDEIESLETDALAAGMRVLNKTHEKSWSNKTGSMKGNLDHVIASDDLTIKQISPPSNFEIEVDGWNNKTGNTRKNWIETISDHCALIGEVL